MMPFPLAPDVAARVLARVLIRLRTAEVDGRWAKGDWDESKHPRNPGGSGEGGEFTSGGDTGGGGSKGGTVSGTHGKGKAKAGPKRYDTGEYLASPADAIEALAAGKYVAIGHEDLGKVLERAGRESLKNDKIDLSRLTIDQTPVFAGGLNLPRDEMPQIPKEHRDAFIKYAKEQGVTVSYENVQPMRLRGTQDGILAQRVQEKVLKYNSGKKTINPIFISGHTDNFVLDGHHRWATMVAVHSASPQVKIKMPVIRLHLPVRPALNLMKQYMKIHGLETSKLAAAQAAIDRRLEALGLPWRVLEGSGFDPAKHPRDEHGQFSGTDAIVKKSPDTPGEWHATFPDGRQYAIYRDISSPILQWEASGLEHATAGGAAFTKKEMLDHLGKLDENRPMVDKYHGHRSGLTVKEHLDTFVRKGKKFRTSGGPGSGNFGHAGRPGEIGGSAGGDDGSPRPVAITDRVRAHPGVEMVAVADLAKFQTQDRRVDPKSSMNITEATQTLLPRLTKELREGGAIQEPLTLAYDTKAGRAILMDGNTRLAAITDAGFTHAPVVISRQDLAGFGGPVPKLSDEQAGLNPVRNWLLPSQAGFRTLPTRTPKALGGPGSGNFGHAGRPGEVGGSGGEGGRWVDSQAVPVEPGTTPLAPGKIRAYHYTDNLDAVLQQGLDVSKAKGSQYGEPNAIWASTVKPKDFKDFVEMHVDPSEIGLGGPDLYGDRGVEPGRQAEIDFYNKGQHDFMLTPPTLPPSRFVTHSTEWHGHYRYIKKNPDTLAQVLAGEHDWMLEHPQDAPAIKRIKQEFGRAAGGPGSGNFGHSGRPGEIGGSAAAGEGETPEEKRAGDLRMYGAKMAKLEGLAAEAKAAAGYEHGVTVMLTEPRDFTVGEVKYQEGGHYDPNTGTVMVNARTSSEDDAGIFVHEIAHAMYDTVQKERVAEHARMSEMAYNQHEMYDKLFSKVSGYPKNDPAVRAQLAEMFPASAAFARGYHDPRLGTWYKDDLDRTYSGYGKPSRDTLMDAIGGHSAYAQSYWNAARDAMTAEAAGGGSHNPYQRSGFLQRRAIDETLAEVARSTIKVSGGNTRAGDQPLDPKWKNFSKQIRAAYKVIHARNTSRSPTSSLLEAGVEA